LCLSASAGGMWSNFGNVTAFFANGSEEMLGVETAVEVTIGGSPASCIDSDGDGFNSTGIWRCGPMDCNDGDASIQPFISENCTDGIDNNCNWLVDSADPECGGVGMPDWGIGDGAGFMTVMRNLNVIIVMLMVVQRVMVVVLGLLIHSQIMVFVN